MANKKENFWIPYADLMTVLMLVFLFISLGFMALVQYQKKKQDQLFENYKLVKENLYLDLEKTFHNQATKWNLQLDKDLSIKFTNPEVLFQPGKAEVTAQFQDILAAFFPKYLKVILDPKYKQSIAEIRIEGHTDQTPTNETNDPYIDNIKLSQDRSRQVLKFLRNLPCYKALTLEQQMQLQYMLTANGLSFGRTLDKNRDYTINSRNEIDKQLSRRVEFRIVTSSEQLVEEIIQQIHP
ncbi:OmpA family protein [Chitinophaga skermanii]|uniref:OmpA family protein n=1 Tax=Chitinophaga skermanii TaxID=331697 RepID=A0A327Q273_9BACT|nr:OmpA family protein [Chitinophaga skermanii]RAI97847.1 OmpA family protein [Chitinophaga skermanii]